jgi:hypothetical protein
LLQEGEDPLDFGEEFGRGVLQGKTVLVELSRGPFELDRLVECISRQLRGAPGRVAIGAPRGNDRIDEDDEADAGAGDADDQ